MSRVERFKDLYSHPWYRTLSQKLSEADFKLCAGFVELHEDLDRDAWTVKVNRLFLDQEIKPKNAGVIADLLLAIK